MADEIEIVYIGRGKRFDFHASEEDDDGNLVAVPLPAGTKLWSGVKLASLPKDPPIITKKNEAAGGDEQQEHVRNETAGLFSAYLQPSDTRLLVDRKVYEIDGTVELADGSNWLAGRKVFEARKAVWETPS